MSLYEVVGVDEDNNTAYVMKLYNGEILKCRRPLPIPLLEGHKISKGGVIDIKNEEQIFEYLNKSQ